MNTKTHTLELLEAHRGETVSGAHIADTLHVSRNAVWKAIGELRKEGYEILAAPNKGYCLSNENDILSPQGIKPFLSKNSVPYEKEIHVYDSLESTNKTAKEMAIAGAKHGTVILSDCQTSGRGRYSRDFFSPPKGGLYMSIILHPGFLCFENATSVTAFAAVSVCEAIEAVSDRKTSIKWVNDILIEGRKVCGILTEAVTDFESGNLDWIVLGIGINVHIPQKDFPRELKPLATSVFPGKTMPAARNRLSAEIINRILGFEVLPKESDIFSEYKKRLMMLGKEITVIQDRDVYRGTAMDIDTAGHLIVKKENGELTTLSSGEIRIRL